MYFYLMHSVKILLCFLPTGKQKKTCYGPVFDAKYHRYFCRRSHYYFGIFANNHSQLKETNTLSPVGKHRLQLLRAGWIRVCLTSAYGIITHLAPPSSASGVRGSPLGRVFSQAPLDLPRRSAGDVAR